MNRFCCKFCGMITDNPTIEPYPEVEKTFRQLMDGYKGKPSAYFMITNQPYNYGITCPICQNETRFWREEPFPTDEPNLPFSGKAIRGIERMFSAGKPYSEEDRTDATQAFYDLLEKNLRCGKPLPCLGEECPLYQECPLSTIPKRVV